MKSAKKRRQERLEADSEFGAEAEVLVTELRLGQGYSAFIANLVDAVARAVHGGGLGQQRK